MSAQEEQDRLAEIPRYDAEFNSEYNEVVFSLDDEGGWCRIEDAWAEVTRLTQEIEILEQVLKEEREELKHHIEEVERLKAAAVSTATKLDGHPPCRVCGSREHCYSARCRG